MKLDAYNILQYKQGDLLFGYRPNTPPGSVFRLSGSFPFKISKAALSPVYQGTTPGIVDYLKIPANTVSANTVIDIQALLSKSGASGFTLNLGISTNNSSLGTQLGILSVNTSNWYFISMTRSLCVMSIDGSGYGTYLIDNQVSLFTDSLLPANAPAISLPIDWTVDQYIIVQAAFTIPGSSIRTIGIKAII